MNEPTTTDALYLINYVMTNAEGETNEIRIHLYRSLAKIVPSEEATLLLTTMAEDFERIESQTQLLLLEINT